jgi:hypothetical protein
MLQIIGVGSAEMDHFKMILNSVWRCPVSVYFDSESESHIVLPNDVIGKVEVHWGKDGFTENTVKVKVGLDEKFKFGLRFELFLTITCLAANT